MAIYQRCHLFQGPSFCGSILVFDLQSQTTASLPWSSKIQFVVLPLDLASGILITDQFNLRNSKWHLGLHLEDTWRHEGHHTAATILHLVVGNAAQKDLQNEKGESAGWRGLKWSNFSPWLVVPFKGTKAHSLALTENSVEKETQFERVA